MMKRLGLMALLGGWSCAIWADGLQSLEHFMRFAKAGQAQFTQTVTAPAKEGQQARAKISTGVFEFQRPGQFKFVYSKPFEQTIVADGDTVWLYDMDLNQVTKRSQLQALGSTPAAILASTDNVSELKKDFTLKVLPDEDGMQWVEAIPKVGDGQLTRVRVGFNGEILAALDILDGFGQRSVIQFENLQILSALPVSTFKFDVPAGADILQQ